MLLKIFPPSLSGVWEEGKGEEGEREMFWKLLFLIASVKNVKTSKHSLLVILESLHDWVVSMRTCLISLYSLKKLFYLLLLGKDCFVDAHLLIS